MGAARISLLVAAVRPIGLAVIFVLQVATLVGAASTASATMSITSVNREVLLSLVEVPTSASPSTPTNGGLLSHSVSTAPGGSFDITFSESYTSASNFNYDITVLQDSYVDSTRIAYLGDADVVSYDDDGAGVTSVWIHLESILAVSFDVLDPLTVQLSYDMSLLSNGCDVPEFVCAYAHLSDSSTGDMVFSTFDWDGNSNLNLLEIDLAPGSYSLDARAFSRWFTRNRELPGGGIEMNLLVIPEPSTAALTCMGLVALAARTRRARRRSRGAIARAHDR